MTVDFPIQLVLSIIRARIVAIFLSIIRARKNAKKKKTYAQDIGRASKKKQNGRRRRRRIEEEDSFAARVQYPSRQQEVAVQICVDWRK